jgi:hypothetical protein|tara:strand:- start:8 stop:232 length:225 start_codon:yes stop_codon:yes gene_type:complete
MKTENPFCHFKTLLRSPVHCDDVRQAAIGFRNGFVKTAGDLIASEFINKAYQIKADAKIEHSTALAEKENTLSA